MYNRQPCVADDSYQLAYEHLRQLECAGHFRASTEVSPFKLVSGKHQVSDGEKECFDSRADVEAILGVGDNYICSVAKDKELRTITDDKSCVNTASVLDRALNSSLAAERSLGTEVVENGKRPSSQSCVELVNKRARQENQVGKLGCLDGNSFVSIPSEGKFSEEAEWTRATTGVGANGKSFEAGNLTFSCSTSNTKEVATGLDQPTWLFCYPGYEVDHRITGFDQLEDVYFQFSEHSHWKHVPVGPDHQADLPKWTSRDSMNLCSRSGFHANLTPGNAATSSADHHDASADKWLGTCVMPMLDLDSIAMEIRSLCSKIGCDCTDEGSIRCVRKHVMAAREKLSRALGPEKFIQMGFSDMGEVVAQTWSEEEENLFHEVVLSNPASVGRNFWAMLRRVFPSRSFKELVSYYFNVFILRRRAHQNRFDCLNVDSDNDEWQESSDVEFAMSEEGEEEEDSVVESPSDVNIPSLKNDASEEHHLVGTKEDKVFKGFKSKSMPAIQTIDRNSIDCAEDQDVQDDSCTSYEGLHNVAGQGNHVEEDHDNLLECRNDGILGLADHVHTDGHGDSKPWKINYVGATKKVIDFFPTCSVIEEVFGKGSPGKATRDGSALC